MAVTYGFFDSVNGDRKYNANQMNEIYKGIVTDGVFQHVDGGLAVSAGSGMTVSVASGRAIVLNHWVQNSAALTLSISDASSTYARIDAVMLRISLTTRSVEIYVKAGEASASPVAPEVYRSDTTYEMALAYVNVSAGATSVTVTDKRSDSSVCGWAAVAQATSGEVDQMLNDMKTGFDGVVYESPAAMVQGEDSKLNTKIDNLIVTDAGYSEVEIPTMTATTGYYSPDGTFQTYNNIYCAEISASENDKFLYSGNCYYQVCGVVFFNESTFISAIVFSNDLSYVKNQKVVCPPNTTKILLQSISPCQNGVRMTKITSFGAKTTTNSIDNDGKNLKSLIDDITADKYETIPITWESATGYYNVGNGVFYTYSEITKAEVDVVPGEKYLLTGMSFYGMAMWCFEYPNNLINNGYTGGSGQDRYTNLEITIPDKCCKMILQRKGGTPTTLKKATGKTIKSVLNGKKVAVIGDSITEYNYRAKTNWSMYLGDWTLAKVQNLGISGTGFAANQPYINRISNIQADADIIGVAMSFNDLFIDKPVGTKTDTGTDTLAGYANDFFDALIAAFPTTPVICYCQGPWSQQRPGGASIDDEYVEVMTQICARHGVPCYTDLYFGCVLRPWNTDNRAEYYTTDNDDIGNTGQSDGTHPNSKGHKVIARYLIPKFAQNIVADGLDYQ